MYSLILDSATKLLYVCLVKDNKVVYESYTEGKNDHAKNIVYKVDEALKTNNITSDDLNEVVVGIGPGSYTGVRMAVAVAKMLAVFKKNIKLYTISTLKLMASGKEGIVLSMIDARRNNSFGMIIDTKKNKYIIDECLISNDELKSNDYEYEVNEGEFVVNPLYVLANKVLVNEPHLLVPNYLRDTEAERNLNA
ncbi:MAG: tRNA (adenosine(37)-N6)-threonylcarbamoyltransferase complex dimerization subunit type 1 TsaB [Acholeplasmatales bacterium]|nr:tRNA (adenosine(37)-N6)-threonylcarbamoyltransferase complex dimerization subunit type 1 TsaB [Acholeplasmatales bacterium]